MRSNRIEGTTRPYSFGSINTAKGFYFNNDGSAERQNSDQSIQELPYFEEEALLGGNHFWAKGYFVSTIGLDEDKIIRYVQHQEKEEKLTENQQKGFDFYRPLIGATPKPPS